MNKAKRKKRAKLKAKERNIIRSKRDQQKRKEKLAKINKHLKRNVS